MFLIVTPPIHRRLQGTAQALKTPQNRAESGSRRRGRPPGERAEPAVHDARSPQRQRFRGPPISCQSSARPNLRSHDQNRRRRKQSCTSRTNIHLVRIAFCCVGFTVALSAAWPALAADAGTATSDAVVVSKQALKFYMDAKYKVATSLYEQAYNLDPSRPEYLYGAARSEHKAGRFQAAINFYEKLLGRVAATAPHAVKAKAHRLSAINALRSQKTVHKPGAAAAPAPAPNRMTASGWRRPAAIGGLVVSASAIVASLLVHSSAAADNAALDAQIGSATREDPVEDITYAEAVMRREDANGRVRMSWALAGVGLAGLGASAWLLLVPTKAPTGSPSKASVSAAIGPSSFALSVRF